MSEPAGKEAAERAKSRRRLLTLAEFVAVAGLMVAALTLYLNWSQRRSDAEDKAATASAQRQERARLDLTATVEGDGRRLLLRDPNHDLQDVAIDFPKASGIGRQAPVGDPAIEAEPIAGPILALTGYNEGPEAERALASGCDGLLGKPICSEVLRSRVHQVLAQAPSGAQA